MYKTLINLNTIIVILLTAAYFYQIIYAVIGLIKRRARPEPEASCLHRFAALICARNESNVIGELVTSLKKQNYPSELLDIYVLADNCTDNTAACARDAGAIVYERNNDREVSKGFALEYLLKIIKSSRSKHQYDAYFIFDADNIVHPDFTMEMNKTFDRGYDAITCYRNSKNFSASWISAAYSTWFLREARFLNYPRMLLGNSCAVSGTGFLVSDKLIEENGGWPFHLLTEDIQFTINCVISQHKIGYCDKAMVFDEQPTTFRQSWKQRLRWSKGFYQVNGKYLFALIKGIFTNKGCRLSCFDMVMTIVPCTLLTVAIFVLNMCVLIAAFTMPHFWMIRFTKIAIRYVAFAVLDFYLGMLAYGALTIASEWKRIDSTAIGKIRYLWAFPIFIASYIPITLVALKGPVEWSPIEHHSSKECFAASTRKS